MALRRQLFRSSFAQGLRELVVVESASSCKSTRSVSSSSMSSRTVAVVSAPSPRRFDTGAAGRRCISSSGLRRQKVKMSFVEDDGNVVEVEAEHGKNLLEVAHDNDVDLEGACGGDLACSTCHVVLPQEFYAKLPEKQEEEDDMLDLAWGLTDTSRLGCQVKVSAEHEGMVIKIPEDSIDMR